MKIVGLITEYNPFHYGHQYHINKSKEISGADYCIAVMSGDFVQRGTPAFLPKHLRAQMALHGGCDMIIELPVCYACGSAEYFASGAISILDSLGCIDSICFGSECGDYNSLEKIAQILVDEPSEFKSALQDNLKMGYNFPLARQKALEFYLNDENLISIINEPNNILGIEYIKAMILRNSKMTGYTITRKDSSYHDNSLSEQYSSASAIRNIFSCNDFPEFEQLKGHVSNYTIDILKKEYLVRYPVLIDDFSLLLRYKLLQETKDSLTDYMDITPELANRIINLRNEFISLSQFTELLKTKELTLSRISRCLMHIILNIKNCNTFTETYAHVLGFRNESVDLFSIIKNSSRIPFVSKLTSLDLLNPEQKNIISQDIYASDLYESVISDKYKQPFINELTQQIVKYKKEAY